MDDSSSLTTLVRAAAEGSEAAWCTIMRRFSPLVAAVCRNCGITGNDVDDVVGSVWLLLVDHIDTIREPAALPGWLRTTTRREAFAFVRLRNRQIPIDPTLLAGAIEPEMEAGLIREERSVAMRAALNHLRPRDRELLKMLYADPPAPYTEISRAMGMPIGAIGPTRARCLARARTTPAIAALYPDD